MTPASQISIVEDDESLRIALIGLIRSLGHDALGFDSAEAFLERLNFEPADCVIADIQLPGMSGLDLQRHLCQMDQGVPVILITARPDPVIEAKARDCGAVCFLRKPFDAQSLVDCVERALER